MSATILQSASAPASAPASVPPAPAPGTSTASRWTGRVLTGIAVLFLTFDTVIKLLVSPEAVTSTVALGYEAHHLTVIGIIELACLVLYLIPRTAPLGAVLFTGYLGGAIATHLRVDNPLLTHTIFPIYVAALVWGGLYLRDARVRGLIRCAR